MLHHWRVNFCLCLSYVWIRCTWIDINHVWEISPQEDEYNKYPPSIHYSYKAIGVNETWQQHLTSIALEARGCMCVLRGLGGGQSAWITQTHPRAMGEQEREECSNNLWITSLWVNIKALCLFFIISQRPWAPGRKASYTWAASHPNYKLNHNSPIFSLKNYCKLEDQKMASLSVCLFSLRWW